MNYVQPSQQQQLKRREDTISLLDLIAVLIKHRWLIVILTFLGATAIVAYSIYSIRAPHDAPLNLLPNVYKPQVKVRLQDRDPSPLSSVLANNQLGFLANLAGGVSTPSSADLAQELLRGNALLDELSQEFNLVERLNVQENPRTSTREFLRKGFETEYSAATGILTIGFEHTDPVFATQLLETAIVKLENRFDGLTQGNVREKKLVLEESIASARRDLQEVQQTLIDFQRENNIVNIELQTEYKLTSVAGVETQIIAAEAEIRGLEETRRPGDPELRATRQRLDQLRQHHHLLLDGISGAGPSLNIPQQLLPELSARLFNLTRDYQILQTVYSGLRSQYETLKIEELDSTARFQVIEQAEIPEVKSGPSRGRISVVVTITVFFLAVFLSFIIEYFDRVKADPVESRKLREIRSMLRLRKNPNV